MADFFQSKAWLEFQKALGEKTVEQSGEGWHFWGRFVRDRLGMYLYLPYGPVVEDAESLDVALEEAKRLAQYHGAYRLVAEPSVPIDPPTASLRFTRQLFGFQPSRTQIVDLTAGESEIIAGMSATRRKQWRSAERKGMTFSESSLRADFDEGVRLLRKSATEKSFSVRDDDYFDAFWKHLVVPGIARIFVARAHGEIQVVAFVIDDDDTRYYLFVGRDLSNNSLQISAPFVTYLMLEARSRGLKFFDLCGISARDDVTDEMTGFTAFKRTFGGKTIQFAGAWDLGIRSGPYLTRRSIDLLHSIVERWSSSSKKQSA